MHDHMFKNGGGVLSHYENAYTRATNDSLFSALTPKEFRSYKVTKIFDGVHVLFPMVMVMVMVMVMGSYIALNHPIR